MKTTKSKLKTYENLQNVFATHSTNKGELALLYKTQQIRNESNSIRVA